jgi:hypothetical protein
VGLVISKEISSGHGWEFCWPCGTFAGNLVKREEIKFPEKLES